MMTSVSSDRSRGAREKTQISATQASPVYALPNHFLKIEINKR